jgi:hypothetical protein
MANNNMWKDIEGYEGLYQISKNGEVKSLERIIFRGKGQQLAKERILKPSISGTKKYPKVILSKNSKTKTKTLHRLLALHFIDNPYNKPCINHIDCNILNYNLNNLEWVTHSENILHSENLGRRNHIHKMNGDRLKELHLNKDTRLKNYV